MNLVAMIILFLYPIMVCTVKGSMNGLIFLLAGMSIYSLYYARDELLEDFDHYAIAFGITVASGLFVIFLSQLYHLDFKAQSYDSASRLLLALPIFLFLRSANLKTITALQYGFPMGAIVAALMVILEFHGRDYPRASTYFVDAIHFGDISLLLGFLAAFSINWTKQDSIPLKLIKIAGLLAGLYVSIRSASRGGWVAIPVLLLLWPLLFNGEKARSAQKIVALLCVIGGLVGYFMVGMIHNRIGEIYTDLLAFSQGNEDTSVGIRLQLWKAAIYLFLQNPIFGVGADGFSEGTIALAKTGVISVLAGDAGKSEVHNEILAHMVKYGVFGLVSILAIYIVPIVIFVKSLRSSIKRQKVAAVMGISVVTSFFIFGLTVEVFDLKMTAAFYSLTVAALLAAATNTERRTNPGENYVQNKSSGLDGRLATGTVERDV